MDKPKQQLVQPDTQNAAATLPENSGAPGTSKNTSLLSALEPEKRMAVEALLGEIKLDDSNAALMFGNTVQQELVKNLDNTLQGIRNKYVGPTSSSFDEIIAMLHNFDGEELTKKPGLISRLRREGDPVAKFLQHYDAVREKIDSLVNQLEHHAASMMNDITLLNRLYDESLEYFHSLEHYILAGQEKLRQLDVEVIPAALQHCEQDEALLNAQAIVDSRRVKDDLERRIQDLLLHRKVTMQALPSIHLVQENDKELVQIIKTAVSSTIPLWRQQLAQSITPFRSSRTATNDPSDEPPAQNAQALNQANSNEDDRIEHSGFEAEVVKRANKALIQAIEENLKIAEEGKARRAAAVSELEICESQLKQALPVTPS
jgi:uncharacterized protein YaaN involved in tellurite resistance